jgi:anti-sigma B factor antagonist
MQRPYQHLDYDEHNGIFCVKIKNRLGEEALEQMGAELGRLVDEAGCRKMVLCLGPGDLDCLYSVFLAKLITLQRRLEAVGGALALAALSPNTHDVFRATGLGQHFRFYPDIDSARQALQATGLTR